MSVITSRHVSGKRSSFYRNDDVKAQKSYQNLHTAEITEVAYHRKCHFRNIARLCDVLSNDLESWSVFLHMELKAII
jgi:hypothetical protein